jgi:polysaccharide biosynthesis protein PslG
VQPSRHHRGRTLFALACAAACTALAAPGAAEANTETFRDGLRSWKGHRATLALVNGGVDGRAARVRVRPGARPTDGFWIYRSPRPIAQSERGAEYTASAWARDERGRGRLCLRVREVAGDRLVATTSACVRANGRWQRLTLRHQARTEGAELGVAVVKPRARRGDAFRVDRVSLVRSRALALPPGSRPAPSPSIPPAPAVPSGGAAFGTQFHCTWAAWSNADRIATLDKLQAAGVRWVRIDVGWYGIEDTHKGARNAWYVGMVDFCVDQARSRGMQVLLTLWLTPGWANGGRSEKVPPTNPQDYADFARWAASHWRGRVAAWEIWNEPDQRTFWDGTIEQYAALVRAAYPGFKAGDPESLVVLAGPSSNDDGLVRRWYELGVKGSFDVLATHPYQGIADAPPEHPDDGNRWWLSHAPSVRAVMDEYGDGAKPIWFTEMGWSAHENWPGVPNWQRGVTQAVQADYLVRSISYVRRSLPFVGVMFWYKDRAKPGSTDAVHEGYALLDADLGERPAYVALKRYSTGT